MPAPRSNGGRPPRNRPTFKFGLLLDEHLYGLLQQRADALGVLPVHVACAVLAAAHDYSGPYLQRLDDVLDMVVTPEELQRRTRALTHEDVPVARPWSMRRYPVVDLELADRIDVHTRSIDVGYSPYICTLLRIAFDPTERAGLGEYGTREIPLGHREARIA